MICPIYDQSAKPQAKAHGSACGSPICNPSGDCEGHYKNCTVPSFIWQKLMRVYYSGCFYDSELFATEAECQAECDRLNKGGSV